MKLTVKLYAGLARYLPKEAKQNTVMQEFPQDITASSIIDSFNIPRESAHLVLLNGVYVNPDDRDTVTFHEKDVLAIWPPVAGG